MNCRLCLTECTNENSFLLFDYNKNNEWTQLISKYLNIQIEENDDFSTVMCDNCLRHLSGYHSFYEFIKSKQVELHEIKLRKEAEKIIINNPPLQRIKTETFEEETITEVTNFIFLKPEPKPEQTEQRTLSGLQVDDKKKKLTIPLSIQKPSIEAPQVEAELETPETTNTKDIDDEEENEEDRTCVICNKMHKSIKGLQSHMYKIHNEVKPFHCSDCGLEFRFRPNYRSHIEEKKCGNRGVLARDDLERRTCMICRKVHKSFQGLQSHIYRYHSNERPFVCNKCGVGFRFEQSLQHHLSKERCGKPRKHKETKMFDRNKDRTCGICNRKFKNVDALSSHMYIAHKGARPFSCKTCGLKFRLRGTYLRHFSKCSGAMPEEMAQLALANADFANSSTEDIEYRTCVLCTRVFDKIFDLYQHMNKEHQSQKPFSCQNCGKCFVLKRALEKHNERQCPILATNKSNQLF